MASTRSTLGLDDLHRRSLMIASQLWGSPKRNAFQIEEDRDSYGQQQPHEDYIQWTLSAFNLARVPLQRYERTEHKYLTSKPPIRSSVQNWPGTPWPS